MGYSFINNTSDPSVIFWNPAGLARLDGTQVLLDVNDWIADIKQYSFALSQSLGDIGVVGLSFTDMDYGTIYGTTINLAAAGSGSFEYIDNGTFSVGNYAFGSRIRVQFWTNFQLVVN